MSKKVLILSGSPRKGGNSDLLCDEFAKGAKEAGNEVKKSVFPKRKSDIAALVTTVYSRAAFASRKTIWRKFCKK